jgi:hypothetical protein
VPRSARRASVYSTGAAYTSKGLLQGDVIAPRAGVTREMAEKILADRLRAIDAAAPQRLQNTKRPTAGRRINEEIAYLDLEL